MPTRDYPWLDSDRTALTDLLRRIERRLRALERRPNPSNTVLLPSGAAVTGPSVGNWAITQDAAGNLVALHVPTGTVRILAAP